MRAVALAPTRRLLPPPLGFGRRCIDRACTGDRERGKQRNGVMSEAAKAALPPDHSPAHLPRLPAAFHTVGHARASHVTRTQSHPVRNRSEWRCRWTQLASRLRQHNRTRSHTVQVALVLSPLKTKKGKRSESVHRGVARDAAVLQFRSACTGRRQAPHTAPWHTSGDGVYFRTHSGERERGNKKTSRHRCRSDALGRSCQRYAASEGHTKTSKKGSNREGKMHRRTRVCHHTHA